MSLPRIGCVVGLAGMLLASPRPVEALTIFDIVVDSEETSQNSEPSIAVNPSSPGEIFITAFDDLDQASFEFRPSVVFFSGNGGAAWSLYQRFETFDASIAWAPGGKPYLVHLFGPNEESGAAVLVRSAELPVAASRFEIIPAGTYASSETPDQPWVVASRANGQDRIYVTYNDFNSFPRTASIQFSLDGGATWKREVLERKRPGAFQDGPPVRSAVLGDTVYVAFQRWDQFVGDFQGFAVGELVVLKDTNAGRDGFRALGPAGVGGIVRSELNFPFGLVGLGQQRIGSGISIAVDPQDANVVYLATEVFENEAPMILVFVTADGGTTWAQRLKTRPHTALPALAVAANGTVALEYTGAFNGLLETHLLQSPDRFTTFADTTLSRFRDSSLIPTFDPFVGDYQRLVAVGNTFHGTFSASNDVSLFPLTPIFQRDRSRLGGRVAYSIDPFYFTTSAITAVPEPQSPTAQPDQAVFQSRFGAEINVLGNDADPTGDTITIFSVEQPPAGNVQILANGRLAYIPGESFTGSDSFTYTIVNSLGKTATATVNVRNPFYAARGAFIGIGSSADHTFSGSVRGNLSPSGEFSARLRFGGQDLALLGDFDIDGDFVSTITRDFEGKLTAFTVQLRMDFATGEITGSLSDGVVSVAITAGLSSFTFENPAPQTGVYTFALPEVASSADQPPLSGTGFGRMRVRGDGRLRGSGRFPDGTPFTFGSRLTNRGEWPVYLEAGFASQTIIGRAFFAEAPASDLAGENLLWSYPLTSESGSPATVPLNLTGSRYRVPAEGERVLFTATDGRGALLTDSLEVPFRLNPRHTARSIAGSPALLSFAVNPKTGFFSGTLTRRGELAPAFLNGVVLQKADRGAGTVFIGGRPAGMQLVPRP